MMDLKQEELDKRYVAGVLAVESALVNRKFMTPLQIKRAAHLVYSVILQEIGEERLTAIQGKPDGIPS